jgi:hypothetical protein
MRIKRRFLAFTLLIVAVPIVIFWGLIIGDAKMWGVETYIDARSGDLLRRKYITYVKVREDVLETAFSKLVRELTEERFPPEWRFVSVAETPLCKIYIDGKWSGGPNMCKRFVEMIQEHNVPKEKQKELLKLVLEDLRKGDINNFHKTLDSFEIPLRKVKE